MIPDHQPARARLERLHDHDMTKAWLCVTAVALALCISLWTGAISREGEADAATAQAEKVRIHKGGCR